MARMGNWRDNKDDEIKLDGIGGVNIMVKADVHRSGTFFLCVFFSKTTSNARSQASTSQHTLSKTKPKQKDSQRWPRGLDMEYTAYQITLSGILIPRRSLEMAKLFFETWDSLFGLFACVKARHSRERGGDSTILMGWDFLEGGVVGRSGLFPCMTASSPKDEDGLFLRWICIRHVELSKFFLQFFSWLSSCGILDARDGVW